MMKIFVVFLVLLVIYGFQAAEMQRKKKQEKCIAQGKKCSDDKECCAERCYNQLCKGQRGFAPCTKPEKCWSGICDKTCQCYLLNESCKTNEECCDNYRTWGGCLNGKCKKHGSWPCKKDEDCFSGKCDETDKECTGNKTGQYCQGKGDCASKNCDQETHKCK